MFEYCGVSLLATILGYVFVLFSESYALAMDLNYRKKSDDIDRISKQRMTERCNFFKLLFFFYFVIGG
jgi:hypothetical protein